MTDFSTIVAARERTSKGDSGSLKLELDIPRKRKEKSNLVIFKKLNWNENKWFYTMKQVVATARIENVG